MNPARVSVILPVHNRAALLPRCIDSVRAQTFTDWELIAVDDASTDDSVAVIFRYSDLRCRILRHETNGGPSAARNTAMRAAQGEFVAWIDSDDEWLPQKLAKQIDLLERAGPTAGLCATDYFVHAAGHEHRVHLPATGDWRRRLHTECPLHASSVVVRRACIERVGLLDEAMRTHEDWDWWMRLLTHYQLVVVPEALTRFNLAGTRNLRVLLPGEQRWFEKHYAEFAAEGGAHLRRVSGSHHARNAVAALMAGEFSLGARAAASAIAANPWLPPDRYAAFTLSFLDGLLGTRLVAAAERLRSRLRR